MGKAKVLIVDDSALMRQLLTELLAGDPALEIVGSACDPYVAWQKIQTLNPDVLTLDVEMPRMDGLTFLERLMRAHPMPVVMFSSFTERGCDTTLRALELGAVDFATKPRMDISRGTVEKAAEIIAKVRGAANAKIHALKHSAPAQPAPAGAAYRTRHSIIAAGASTGGTEALRQFLGVLPADAPGIVIVQHMPEHFTRSFADRLDGLSRLNVSEARDGDRILPGHAFIAPGNYHMEVVRSGGEYRTRVFAADPVNRHRPSVDVLFHSCARELGSKAVGILMTGMGDDGARGLLAMRQAGAHTVAQDEATCVVFGMPREAIALGAAERVLPLGAIGHAALSMIGGAPA